MDTKERLSEDTPIQIVELFQFPYKYFADLFSSSNSFTLLDIACGNALQKDMLLETFSSCIFMDSFPQEDFILKGNILDIPLLSKSIDVCFCFETIEHVEDHQIAVDELLRVTKKFIVVGSVNKDGPSFIDGVEIYKGAANPFHVRELGVLDFLSLFRSYNVLQFFSSRYDGEVFYMDSGLTSNGYCNYVLLAV